MTQSKHANEKMVPVLYCDIDGTIRWGKDELGRFVNTAEDVRVFDGVADLLWAYKKLGWRIIGVSNQGGIALGYMDMATCVKAMAETQKQTRFAFDKLVWCSHHPDAKDPAMAVCWCRKPKTGLVIEAALDVSQKTGEIYPPHMGFFVGDRLEDAECADNAGLQFMNAVDWREGRHLNLLNYHKDLADVPKLSAATINEVLSPPIEVSDERLPSDVLDLSLKMIGVKTKTVPISELEVGADFVHEGHLYTVVEKGDLLIKSHPNSSDMSYLTVYDPHFLQTHQMSPGCLPWTTKVITDDDVLKKSLEITGAKTKEMPVWDLAPGANFVYEGVLYKVTTKSELLLRAVTVDDSRLIRTFYDDEIIKPRQMSSDSVSWFVKVMTDA